MRLAWIALLLATPAFAAPAPVGGTMLEADLDGDGSDDVITLEKDGTLSARGAKLTIEFEEPDVGAKNTKIEVVGLGGKRRGIYLVTSLSDGEDPPDRHQVVLYDKGKLRIVYNQSWDTHRIVFSKLGTGRLVESGWAACGRASETAKKPVTRAPEQIITLKLDAKGKKLVETRRTGKAIVKCDELSACPFVYEVVGGEPVFMGEILRNIRYEPALQALWLGKGGATTIKLTEEKPEVTFVDEVYLEVDGVRVPPKACLADPALDYCAADGHYRMMTTGDVVRLEFAAPAGNRYLYARGYYVPTESN